MSRDRTSLFALMGIQLGAFHADQVGPLDGVGPSELANRLVDSQVLDVTQRQAIESIVAAHLSKHGDDAKTALQALLVESPDSQHALDQMRGVDNSSAESENSASRYRILRFHDEGGLGQVFEAEDQELQRGVALKEIQLKFANDKASRTRFEREARITGALEHPGIVPIYGLGYYDDGRPYYAMRMIRGESLRDAIRAFHSMDQRAEHSQRALAQRRLLGQFLDVCHAIGYAHQRGVLHRDIKPGNIMLGKYGETLVVDWGLAKQFDAKTDNNATDREPALRYVPEDHEMHTMIGRAVGSPLYMSPEQARGDSDNLGPATDIYSLGATLFTILTDQSSVDGNSKQDVLENVRRGKIRSARSANPRASKVLSSICSKAMQLRAEERYPTVSALSDDIERFLADEPVTAYRENVLERGWRFVRKHRNKVMAASAAAIVLAVSSIAALLISQSRSAEALAQREEELAVAERQSMSKFVRQLYMAVPVKAGKSGLFTDYLTRVDQQLGPRYLNPDADDYNANAHAALTWFLGSAYMPMGMNEEAATFLEKHLPIVINEVGETQDTTLVMDKLANSYVQIGRPKQAIPVFEDILRIREQLGIRQRETIRTYDNLARAHATVGNYTKAIALREQVLDWSRTLEPIDDKRIASALHNLGLSYLENGDHQRALEMLCESHELRKRILSPTSTKTISSQQGIASALMKLGRDKEALEMLTELRDTCREKFGEDHRTTWRVFEDVCRAQLAVGEVENLTKEVRQLTAARNESYEPGHPLWSSAQTLLAQALDANGYPQEALETMERIVAVAKHRYQVDTLEALGQFNLRRGNFESAKSAFEKAVEIIDDYYGPSHSLHAALQRGLAACENGVDQSQSGR